MSDWYKFWQKERTVEINHEKDLLYQVYRTVNKKPISNEEINIIVQDIKDKLALEKEDVLLDLGCGNGVITYSLSKYVKTVVGVDFSKQLIYNAKKYKFKQNIHYIVANLLDKKILEFDYEYNKILISAVLQYITLNQFDEFLNNLNKKINIKSLILINDILDADRKWKFFRTFRQKLNYLIKIKLLRKNLGLGKWWNKNEIIILANKYKYSCEFFNQNERLSSSHYRFDVLLIKKSE